MFGICIALIFVSCIIFIGGAMTYGLHRWAGGKQDFITFLKNI